LGFNETHLLFDDRPANNDEVVLGSTFFVDSGVDSTDGRSPKTAFGTIDEAVNKCTAYNGDKIVVMAGHAETISGATGID